MTVYELIAELSEYEADAPVEFKIKIFNKDLTGAVYLEDTPEDKILFDSQICWCFTV